MGWRLSQAQLFNGNQKVYVFPTRVKIENSDLGYTLIMDEPSAVVDIFNDHKKLRCRVPLNKFHSSVASTLSVAGECPAGLPWVKTRAPQPKDLANVPGTWYLATEAKNLFAGSEHGGYLAGAKRVEHAKHMLFVSSAVVVAPALNKIFCELQGEPRLDGFPLLQFVHFVETGRSKYWLQTTRADKIRFDQVDWKIPDYKEGSQLDVLTSKESRILEELF